MADMQECKICRVKKMRMYSEMRGKDKLFLDELGRQWHGKTCNTCQRTYVRTFVRALRQKRSDGSRIDADADGS